MRQQGQRRQYTHRGRGRCALQTPGDPAIQRAHTQSNQQKQRHSLKWNLDSASPIIHAAHSGNKEAMLENLSGRLAGVVKSLRGQARITEANVQDTLRQVRLALLEADVALPVVKDFIEAVKTRALGQEVLTSLSPGQALIGIVHEELTRLMGGENAELNLAATPPAVILMAGLQGSGKTTTSGKLALLLKNRKKKVLLASADVYRPAAIDQLRQLGKQLDVAFFEAGNKHDPLKIAKAAQDHARKQFYDVLIVDTAGRLAGGGAGGAGGGAGRAAGK